jgi:hypothetical protein
MPTNEPSSARPRRTSASATSWPIGSAWDERGVGPAAVSTSGSELTGHDLARRHADDRVDDDARHPVRQVDEIVDLELLAAANLEEREQVRGEAGEEACDRGERRAVVATVRGPADKQPDLPRRVTTGPPLAGPGSGSRTRCMGRSS